MKKLFVLLLALGLCLSLCACGAKAPEAVPATQGNTLIELKGDYAEINGPGAIFENGVLYIGQGGSFEIMGQLEGMIEVSTGSEKQDVQLVLNGASIRNPNGPALHIEDAKDTTISVPADGESFLISGTAGELAPASKEAKGAALDAEDDVEFAGPGTLNIEGYINNGISCKNDVKVSGGTLNIKAANNGLKGEESVKLPGGVVFVECLNDGIKTENREKEGKGDVIIDGASLAVQAGDQGINAVKDINILSGTVSVVSQRDGLKAGTKELAGNVNISGGATIVRSGNDAIDASLLSISGGELLALGADKDIKTQLQSGNAYFAGELRVDQGLCFQAQSEDGKHVIATETSFEVKSAYISLPGMKSGDICLIMTGSNNSDLKESRNFIMK